MNAYQAPARWQAFFARFDFIGGSLLRWDWSVALLLGVVAPPRPSWSSPARWGASLELAVFFTLWLAFEYARGTPARTAEGR